MCVSKDTKLLKKFLVVGTVAATIGAVLFALLSSVIMLVLGGEEYMEGAYLLVLAAPMLVFSYPAILLGYPTLGAFGEAKRLSASSVISAAFHIIGLVALLLIDHFSIAGVAILRSITELVLLIARVAFAYIVLKNSKEDQSGN